MLELTDMTETEQVRCFAIEDRLTRDGTMDRSTAKTYSALCIERARGYAARVAAMQIPLYLQTWAAEMATEHATPEPRAHHNLLPWLEAFLVSRYGEAEEQWPAELTVKDLARARDWKTNGLPPSITI